MRIIEVITEDANPTRVNKEGKQGSQQRGRDQ